MFCLSWAARAAGPEACEPEAPWPEAYEPEAPGPEAGGEGRSLGRGVAPVCPSWASGLAGAGLLGRGLHLLVLLGLLGLARAGLVGPGGCTCLSFLGFSGRPEPGCWAGGCTCLSFLGFSGLAGAGLLGRGCTCLSFLGFSGWPEPGCWAGGFTCLSFLGFSGWPEPGCWAGGCTCLSFLGRSVGLSTSRSICFGDATPVPASPSASALWVPPSGPRAGLTGHARWGFHPGLEGLPTLASTATGLAWDGFARLLDIHDLVVELNELGGRHAPDYQMTVRYGLRGMACVKIA